MPKDKKVREELTEKYKAFAVERNALSEKVDEQGLELIKKRDYIEKELTKESPDYEDKMQELDEAIAEQKSLRSKVLKFDEFIENVKPTELLSAKDFEDIVGKNSDEPVTDNAVMDFLASQNTPKRSFADNIGDDFFGFLQEAELTSASKIKSRAMYSEQQADGSTFNVAATFNAILGKNQADRKEAVKSLASKNDDSQLGLSAETYLETLKERREAVKSMFTQTPLAGGDGSQYNPVGVFAGNTGGLCEYDIDNDVAILPYPKLSFLDCIPFEQIPKSYRLFVRQTLRISNADSVGETIYSPPVDFIVDKPESQYGFTQNRAYTVIFANTIPVSEEFLEDCPAIADIVRNQLLRDTLEAFYAQLLNGDGSTGANPQLVGFFNTAGVSTRIHRGASSYNLDSGAVAQGAGLAGDTTRDTVERSVFDSEAFGYDVDCALLSHDDYVDMAMLKKPNSEEKLYTEAELNNIRGARVRYDTRITAGTGLVAPFGQTVKALIRKSLQFDIGWTNKQFIQDTLTLRARMRAGNIVKQPFALIRLSGM